MENNEQERPTNFWDFANENAGCLIPAAVVALILIAFIVEDIINFFTHGK